MGQNVVGTFGIWDNSLFFGTDMHWDKKYWDKMSLGQFTCGQKVFGTILLGSIIFGTKGIGKITKGQFPWVYLQCTAVQTSVCCTQIWFGLGRNSLLQIELVQCQISFLCRMSLLAIECVGKLFISK